MLQKFSFAGNFVLMAVLVVAASIQMFHGLEAWHLKAVLFIGLMVSFINVFAGVEIYDERVAKSRK